MDFQNSLVVGKNREYKVLKTIQKKYPCAYIREGKFKQYDIYIPEIDQSVEVKQDQKSLYTGNLVVEMFMYGKPSGLQTTTADWWVFCDGVVRYWVVPSTIYGIIERYGLQTVEFVGEGDTESKKAYLIKKEYIADIAKLITIEED